MNQLRLSLICVFFLSLVPITANCKSSSVKFDFDKDGVKDEIRLIEGSDLKIEYKLSTHGGHTVRSKSITEYSDYSLRMENDNLLLLDNGMRYFYYYTFAYNPRHRDLQLISTRGERSGNVHHDGEGAYTYNLISGLYTAQWNYYNMTIEKLIALPKIKKYFPVKYYSLQNFGDKMIDQLSQADNKTQPKCLRPNYKRRTIDMKVSSYY